MVKNAENPMVLKSVLFVLPILTAVLGFRTYTEIQWNAPIEEAVQTPIEIASSDQGHEEKRHIEAYISYANPKLSPVDRQVMVQAIYENANQYSLPMGLVVAVIHIESNFNAGAIGPKTKYGRAMGAMQVMWPVHKGLAESVGVNEKSILTADGGVKVGCLLLSRYITAEKSITGGLIRFFSQPSPQYVLDKVMTAFLTYHQLSSGLLGLDMIAEAHKTEIASMKRLTKKKGR